MKRPGTHRKTLFALLLAIAIGFPGFAPKAQAFEPVTMALFAPLALKAASIALPYIMRGLNCGGIHMFKIGYDIVDIFRLPVGLFQTTLGIPFGLFDNGVNNIGQGLLAPLKLGWDACTLPIALSGVSTGS